MVLFGLLCLTIASSYYKYLVLKDYIVESETSCDPYNETCYVKHCDNSEKGACTGNPDEDISYYKIEYRNARNIICTGDNDCDFSCTESEKDCGEVACTADDSESIECYTKKTEQ